MVLTADDDTLNSLLQMSNPVERLCSHLINKEGTSKTKAFASSAITVFDQPTTDSALYHNYVYVEQREYAVLRPNQLNDLSIVGSDNATTCCLIVLWHRESGCAAVAHYDGQISFERGRIFIDDLLKAANQSNRTQTVLSCALIGCYVKNISSNNLNDRLLREVLELLNKYESTICIEIACVGRTNTSFHEQAIDESVSSCYPRHYGCAINLKTLHVFPAKFIDKQPAHLLRYSRLFAEKSESLHRVWDYERNRFVISPFNWFQNYQDLSEYATATDSTILNSFSTSPLVESKDFAPNFRNVIAFMLRHSNGTRDLFKNSQPICYALDSQHNWMQQS